MGVEVCLRDGPYGGTTVGLDQARLPETLMVPDPPLPEHVVRAHSQPQHGSGEPPVPSVPMAIYELTVEMIGPDGEREGDYRFAGHTVPGGGFIPA